MTDVYQDLAAFSWRGVEVPTTSFSTTVAQDLVEHKYWGRDGADVEATGRAPLKIHARIPFINDIFPGKNERWSQGFLYPGIFRTFVAAMADRTTGVLDHPDFGKINCKPTSMSTEWNGQSVRNGLFVEAEWIETFTESANDGDFLSGSKEITVQHAAASLESQKLDVAALLPPNDQTDFWAVFLRSDIAAAANFATSIGGRVGIQAYSLAGKLSALEYAADRVERSLNVINNPLTWPARESCIRLRESAQKARETALHGARPVLFYTTKKTLTLAGVSNEIAGAKMGDLLRLNPSLATSPIVPEGTRIRYFAPRVA